MYIFQGIKGGIIIYLSDCLIENAGPIESLDLTASFNVDGTPKPLVIVGKNGTGKSILLSYIVDSLFELAKKAYDDIVPNQQFGLSPFFKISGKLNQRYNCEFSLGLLDFLDNGKKYSYREKTGSLDKDEIIEKTNGRFADVLSWQKDGVEKKSSGDKKELENIFRTNSICYFPPSRKEIPHWLNKKSLSDNITFDLNSDIAGMLGKPIYVESCVEENKKWVMDVFLDSKVDLQELAQENQAEILGNKQLLMRSRINVEVILKEILEDSSAKFGLGYRSDRLHRLHILLNKHHIPSLDHLSSGQSILFNLFATVIRYADKANINKSIRLGEIEGIVVIDEVDAHLDTDLQHDVLPKLLRLFPHVQFILTTHSPIFLLGMERQYGKDGFEIIEMPSGQPISTERFSEFTKAFEFLKNSMAFEEELKLEMRNLLPSITKPMVLLEGKTDLMYIKRAFDLLGHNDILEKIEINYVGKETKEGSKNSGSSALEKIEEIYSKHNRLLKHKLLLLYDCDINKQGKNDGNLYVESVPKNENDCAFSTGIENLLPADLLKSDYFLANKTRFYRTNTIQKDFKKITTEEFNKYEFCKWVCEERNEINDFRNFNTIIDIIDTILSRDV